ncbi:hypothetical protein [Photobacterium sp. J15]|uniref:hypothetical protein n=1 Tax=Photobacterium sp. J15 TaxID=265901 RepID=UPI0007E46C66|nr:hypothetical protein [Photobacterium sp. J15]
MLKEKAISKAEKERLELMERLAKARGTLASSANEETDSAKILSIAINSTATFESCDSKRK